MPETMTVEKAVESITGQIDQLAERVKTVEGTTAELKGLDDNVKSLKGELESLREAAPEKKSLDDLGGRLDGLERKLNELGDDHQAGGGDAPEGAARYKSLDEAMESQSEVQGELKSLDSDLKQQTIILDSQLMGNYPVLERAFRRPCRGDNPKYSYPTGATVQKKSVGSGQVASERKKVAVTIEDYEYQPTIDRGDVQDVGGSTLLNDEQQAHREGTADALNADAVDGIEAAGEASVSDVYTEVEIVETATTSWAASDVDTLWGKLGLKYRPGAVFIANSGMETTLMNLVDGDGNKVWRPSLAEGVPPTLRGKPFITDENVKDDRLILTNPRRGLVVFERERSTLSNIERSGGDYKPYYVGRYGVAVTDARASKIMDKATS